MSRELHPVPGWGPQDRLCPRDAPSQAKASLWRAVPSSPQGHCRVLSLDTLVLFSPWPRPRHPVGVKPVACQPCHIPTAWLLPRREAFHGRCKRSFGCQVIKPGNYQCRAASSWPGGCSGDPM